MHQYNGNTFELEGYSFRAHFERDDDISELWANHDGHGVASDWTRRNKRPGEVVLVSDRASRRYYDIAASNQIAKNDGWGLSEEDQAELIKRLSKKIVRRVKRAEYQIANGLRVPRLALETVETPGIDPSKRLTGCKIRAEAVRRDFEFLRQWCNEQWEYMWVKVTILRSNDDGELVEGEHFSDSVGGVESHKEYHVAVAFE
ncbi:hypothetical protein [Burkholderia paludis]|uniref:hypothetical protein n=1 Tax=Burkholderia paludis TaxID=1506587 RepID=UPI00126A6D38|nr:hypothetical protein [Burkholderia paludis]